MALTIEDGSGVPNANSYVSVAEIKAFNEARGITLPSSDDDIEKLAVEAYDYVESFRSQYQGQKTNLDPDVQNSQWPRTGVVIDGWDCPPDRIPSNLKNAQCRAASYSYSDGPLMPSSSAAVVREKIDVLEVQYAEPQTSDGQTITPSFPEVDNYLEPLFSSGGGYRVKVIRA